MLVYAANGDKALKTCADMIRGNARLQEGFAQLQVTPVVDQNALPDGTAPNGITNAYVIDALLDLALSPAPVEIFDARFAACECIKAYFADHVQIRLHFLRRAIQGHVSGDDETANVLTTLLTGPQGAQVIDPYRLWFAATLVFHLIFEDLEAKKVLMQVAEGDAESGEEVVTCIQALTANLIASLQLGEDERISIAYLMLLSGWLFEDGAAVNDFLHEASSLQSLVQAASKRGDQAVIRGLCAVLLGIVYEFSTKDSPVPRRELQPTLTTRLGRERYLDAITKLRHHPLVRDFEVLDRDHAASFGNLPSVFFDTTFIDFLKDNFSRFARAIDREPGFEIHRAPNGVDRDLVDTLRGVLDEKTRSLEQCHSDLLTLEQKLNQEQADHRKSQESSAAQLNTVKRINEELHSNHDADLAKLEHNHQRAITELEKQQNAQVAALDANMQQTHRDHTRDTARIQHEYDNKLRDALRLQSDLERRLGTANEAHQQAADTIAELEARLRRSDDKLAAARQSIANLEGQARESEAQAAQLKDDNATLRNETTSLKTENRALRTEAQDHTWKTKDAAERLRKAEAAAKESEDKRSAVQSELDDLFIMLGELEEKRAQDKVRLDLHPLLLLPLK